ncbi:MAG TPA: gamma-glutamyl-gamma-aminobutyrate hydrolase family protein, partial [Actinomycetota bacterium]|nr:gamma-glutamyl-gamma-aminobutyrate hydrolase family protein [Actinomycetota bacterium]
GIFEGIPSPFEATRYHSLVVKSDRLPVGLQITASTSDGVIMGLEHERFPIYGVQFHPESILTTVGMNIIRNFLESVR